MKRIINYEKPRTGRVVWRKSSGYRVHWFYGQQEFISYKKLARTFIFEGMPTKVYEVIDNGKV